MKTFAEMLPTATAEMREFVEAYQNACCDFAFEDDGAKKTPLQLMRSTPPAKEPVSVESEVEKVEGINYAWLQGSDDFKTGDRVRVVKIEEIK